MTWASRAIIFLEFGPGSGVIRFGNLISVAIPIGSFTGSSNAADLIPAQDSAWQQPRIVGKHSCPARENELSLVYANKRGRSNKREGGKVTRLVPRGFTYVSSGPHHRGNLQELLLARRVDLERDRKQRNRVACGQLGARLRACQSQHR